MGSVKPLLELELRPVEAPSVATPGARVFVMLPRLGELVGVAGFGSNDPIYLPGTPRPWSPRAAFARFAPRRDLH